MPRPKLSFKENHFAFEVTDVEFTVGDETVKVGAFKGELDVNDLLRTRLPQLSKPRGVGTGAYFTSVGDKKIQCIKLTRALTGMGLKEAKLLTERLPVLINSDMPLVEREIADRDLKIFCDEVKGYGGMAEMVSDTPDGPTVLDVLRDLLTETIEKGMK
ncbi:MAG: hypothetical protein DRH08_12405 [Deltaproteobacteria bacterium]|nr:MAG: hypothetical protein DRH08_12405 [Deltaproteobacteria bacterium]